MANDEKPEPYNPPPSPYGQSGLSDAEFKRMRKAWNEYVREYQAREDARKARLEARKTPEQRAQDAEDAAVKRADQWSFDRDVQDRTGMSLQEIRDMLSAADDLTPAEKAAWDATRRADSAWLFKASKQRDAAKKLKKAKGDLQKRKKRLGGLCSLLVVVGVGYATLLGALIAGGAYDVWSSLHGV